LGHPRYGRIDRHQIRLRHRPMRRLHRAHQRRRHALVPSPRRHRRRQADHHHRVARSERQAAPGAAGLARSRRAAMRLLPERHDDGGGFPALRQGEGDRCRYRRGNDQYLPLWNLPTRSRRDPRGGGRGLRGDAAMTYMPKFNRRFFIVGSSAAGAGLALGFNLPFAADVVRAADIPPEVDAWVVIKPDDTVVIRIARSEMGQGTLTGLAQLVAEELDCDWSKVTTEFPTPGQNVARKRVWGDFSTGGSRGIRDSNEYVRKGGAMARMMLVQAAANAWNVPVAECSAANSVITHKASNRTVTYGKVAEAAGKLDQPKDVPLKDPKDWKIAGKPLKRLDTADKIVGKMIY